jgi:hypothetical protein
MKAISLGHHQEETNLKPTGFFFTIAASTAFALPGWAATVVPDATMLTSLTSCEVQTCGVNPHTLTYNGLLSGYSTQTVGEGAFISASGFASPVLSAQVPTSGANADINAQLTYFFEVVPNGGSTTPAPVLLGVSAVGTNTVNTTGNGTHGNPSNSASSFLGLQVVSNSGGAPVFIDNVILQYQAGINNDLSCTSTTDSSAAGVGVVGASTVSCGASSGSGGITEAGSYMISTNQVYAVTLQTDITVGTANDGNASGAGTVEGIVTMDPTFTVPVGYSLILSASVGNGTQSGVPEPATWTMLAAGMVFLILANRQRVSRANRAGVAAQ